MIAKITKSGLQATVMIGDVGSSPAPELQMREYKTLTPVELVLKWKGELPDDRTVEDVLFEKETEEKRGSETPFGGHIRIGAQAG